MVNASFNLLDLRFCIAKGVYLLNGTDIGT